MRTRWCLRTRPTPPRAARGKGEPGHDWREFASGAEYATSASHRLECFRAPAALELAHARGVLDEVLAEHRLLTLVVGAHIRSIEQVRSFAHVLEGELAHRLAVLDHERHIAGPDLERCAASMCLPALCIAEPRVKEARV